MNRLRQLLRDTRGHATAEAVIMLPVFIIVWGAIIFVSQGFEAALDIGARNRQAAWTHVMNDCEGGVDPGVSVSDATDPPFGPLGELFALVDAVFSTIPIYRDYWPGLVPEERRFRVQTSVAQPRVLGTGSANVNHDIVLMCNERYIDTNLREMSSEAWRVLIGD
jgi:hypothetical protein